MPKAVDTEERREALAAAAAQLIARAGIGAATMRDVAAEAGWTTGVLTHYFADKRELLLFTFRSSLARRHSAREARHGLTPNESLVGSLEGVLPLDDDRRRHWMVTIAFCAHAVDDEELAAAQRGAYREFRGYIAELVRLRPGVTAEADAISLAERLIAVADGIAVQALFDPASWPAEKQRDALHRAVESLSA
jgi:AcrR family transcriptional regulator